MAYTEIAGIIQPSEISSGGFVIAISATKSGKCFLFEIEKPVSYCITGFSISSL